MIHSTQPQSQPWSQDGKTECNYCREEHLHDCPHINTDIKSRRNQEKEVVLSTGSYVPQDITGKYLYDCIKEWHRRHPNQLAAATLIHTINKKIVDAHQPTQPMPHPQLTYWLTTNNCIAVLEAELFNLRARRALQAQYNCTHAQKARNANQDNDNKAVAAARAQQHSRIEEVPDEDATQPPKETPSASTQPANIPEHPFQLAKDTAYSSYQECWSTR